MSKMKRQVIDILELWTMGASIARIAKTTGQTPEVVQYVIDQYGEDVVQCHTDNDTDSVVLNRQLVHKRY